MDGSRGAKNTPRPKANPTANRPGARKLPEKPAVPSESAQSPEVSRPAAGLRGAKPVVDEDDPFGVGSASAAATAVPASLRPEKGKLHKVVCPMCEQVGFVPKSAIGKSVRCANDKCMVPVFTASEGGDNAAERRPVRRSDEAEAARKAAEASRPAKRNPLVIYGIVGGVLLILTVALIPLLTKPPESTGLNAAIPLPEGGFGPDEEELARQEQEAAAAAKAALDAVNPAVEAAALAKRMISLARQPNLRDKAWARRMTGDLYLRLGESSLAAQEFNQLLVVERTRSYYRMDPHLGRYWRAVASSDADDARKALSEALNELAGVPKSGRLGMEAALGAAAALVHSGDLGQATQLIEARKLDITIPHNRDLIASTAWSFVAFRCRDVSIAPPPVQDSLLWINPLHTAVALDLAVHGRWSEAVTWAASSSDPRTITDGLTAILDLSDRSAVSPESLKQISTLTDKMDPISSLRIRAAIAAASKDAAGLDACFAAFSSLPAASPVRLPSSTQLVQEDVPDRSQFIYQAMAVGEVVRAAAVLGKPEQQQAALGRMRQELSAIAPPTPEVRTPVNEIANDEAGFRRQLAAELRVSDEVMFASMFRNYRRHLEQYARAAEDRRLLEILLLSRAVRVGGVSPIQKSLADSPEFRSDLLLDELTGLLSLTARSSDQEFPEVFNPDPSLRRGRAGFGNAALILPIAAAADQAWTRRNQNLGACLKLLESGAGTGLPGLRQAFVSELVESAAQKTTDPAPVLLAISQLQNGLWREEAYLVAARVFADRGLDEKADAWLTTVRIPAMEQVCLLYGISLGILERPIPSIETSGDSANRKRQASAVN